MRGVLALLLLLAAPLAAQGGRLERAEMSAEVDEGAGRAPVEIDYDLWVPRGTRTVPLRGLLAFGTRVTDVEARVGAWSTPVTLRSDTPPLVTGSILLPDRVSADSTIRLTLRYAVERAVTRDDGRFQIVFPVLFVDWRPAAAPANTFVSRSRIPAGFSVSEGFPSVPRTRVVEPGSQTYGFSLQVIPAFVSLRGRTGTAPLLSLETTLDLVIIPILLGLGFLTWIMMRRDHFWLPGDPPAARSGEDD